MGNPVPLDATNSREHRGQIASAINGMLRDKAASFEILLSSASSLAAADALAVRVGGSVVIDKNVTLVANTTLNAKTVRFAGGVITRGAFNLTINGEVSAGHVAIFDKSGAGAVAIAKGPANLAWFAPTGDGTTDDSIPLNRLFALNRPVVDIPPAYYACNATLPYQVICRGAGDRVSVMVPFNIAKAAWEYNAAHSFQMASHFSGLGFVGPSGGNGTGIGFSCGATDPANYTAGMENIGNVTFQNCRAVGLVKGFLCNYGNIGCQWNDCQLQANYYGAYFLNNKFGAGMHAGNKYFRGGEISGNTCGIYVNNGTQDGFGGITSDGTIFENNVVNVYGYTNSGTTMVSPFAFRNYWSEVNGNLSAGNPAGATLDVWTGTVKTTTGLVSHAWIFDGDCIRATFDDGFFSDCWLRATNSIVVSENDRVETLPGYGGNDFVVTSPSASRIIIRDPSYDAGGTTIPGVVVEGAPNQKLKDISLAAGAPGRCNIIPRRMSVNTLNNLTGVAAHFDAASNLTGSKTVTGTQTVGGLLYPHYTAYSDTFTNAQFCRPAVCNMTLSAGYWVVTFDLLMNAGSAIFKYWDQSANTFLSIAPIADSQWHTYGGIGLVSGGTPALGLDVTGSTGGAVTSTFGLSSFQCWQFPTLAEAQDFLRSRVYAS